MAISRDKKTAIVSDLLNLINTSQLTTFAQINGLSVAEAQELRRQATTNQTVVRVVKNRLVKIAMQQSEHFKQADTSSLKGQLLYAFNADDEVASAKNLADFAKIHDSIKLMGGYDATGRLLGEAEITQLAALPSKDNLRSQLIGTMSAPVSGFVRVLAGNVSGLLYALKARQEQLSNSQSPMTVVLSISRSAPYSGSRSLER